MHQIKVRDLFIVRKNHKEVRKVGKASKAERAKKAKGADAQLVVAVKVLRIVARRGLLQLKLKTRSQSVHTKRKSKTTRICSPGF